MNTREGRAMNWQPIETAPEGGHILVGGPGWVRDCESFDPFIWVTLPTHWMPLPDPPEQGR